jgi:non-ribosomal peptide synthetase, terminal component
LPAPDAEALATHAYEAPFSVTERTLEIIWRSVLGIKRVGRNDNFFELGGNSLLLVDLQNKMKREGFSIEILDAMKNPTIASMSSFLTSELNESALREKIVKLKDGSGVPLFIIHDASGEIVSYAPLVNALSLDVPVYGISAFAFDNPSQIFCSIKSMAVNYAKLIKNFYGTGPYRLAGWCTAGGVAMEVAIHLIKEGGCVDFIGLIDTGLKSSAWEERDDESMKCEMIISFIKRLHPDMSGDKMIDLDSIDKFEDLIEKCFNESLFPEGFSSSEIKRRIDVSCMIAKSWEKYSMEDLPGNLYMFAATEFGSDGSRFVDTWKGNVDISPTIELIGGDHHTIMLSPNVHKLASRISSILSN